MVPRDWVRLQHLVAPAQFLFAEFCGPKQWVALRSMLTSSSTVLAGVAIVLVAHCREHGPEMISMLGAVLGQRSGSQTKPCEVLDAALWDIRVKQYVGTARVYVHLTAFCILVMACQMLSEPASLSPLQISMAAAGWIQHHAESAVLSSVLVCSVRFSVAILSADIQTTVPGLAMFTMYEIWVAWGRDPSTVTRCLVFQLMISSAILAVSGLVEYSTRSRIAMLLNSESMVASFRQMLSRKRRLLMTSDVTSQSFEELLYEEERPRFLRGLDKV
eukprot:s1836_g13.t1